MKKKQGVVWFVVAVTIIALIAVVMAFFKRESPVQYRTVEVRRGTLAVEVTATGSISPRTLYQGGHLPGMPSFTF